MMFFGQKSIFVDIVHFFWYHHDGTPKRQLFCVDCVARRASGRPEGLKNSIFEPQKGHFGQSGPKNGPPSGRTASYRKTEVIQSYLRMWGSYDPIESGPSEPKKWGLYGRSVKKCTFSGQKWAPAAAPRPAVRRSHHKKVVFLDFGPENSIFGQKICFFLRYTHITPLFWARTDPTQWDHNFPTS